MKEYDPQLVIYTDTEGVSSNMVTTSCQWVLIYPQEELLNYQCSLVNNLEPLRHTNKPWQNCGGVALENTMTFKDIYILEMSSHSGHHITCELPTGHT